MKVLTAAQMQQVDRLTTERFSVLGLTLMETAGLSAVAAIENHFGPLLLKHVKIFCGKGNNGGDGAVVARHLWLRGAIVELFLLGKFEETRGDARVNFEAVKKLSTVEAAKLSFQEIELNDELREALNEPCDLYIDALFGTGASRPLTGLFKELVETINESGVPVVAIDIPSGLNAENSEIIGPTVRARMTVTMTAPKLANVMAPAMHYNGTLVISPIGSPNSLIAASGSHLSLVEREQIENFLTASRRSPGAHKNSVGNVLVVAGGRGKTGAAGLTAEAVLRSGAGLVTLASPRSSQQVAANSVALEIMTEPLEETSDGMIAAAALKIVLNLAEKKSLIALGPGIGTDEETRSFVRALVEQRPCPLVIDADGLNCLSPWPEGLRGSQERPIVLTPHPGEMQRLLGSKLAEAASARADIVRDFAMTNQLILVLKGECTLIATNDGEVYINPTGNAGMATAGSGDVLTGIIAGLIAQSPSRLADAVISGVYLHGLAGDLAAKTLGQRSVMASDLIKQLPAAILAVGGEVEKRNFSDPLG
jgi:ADP-dependent NAD(P)H-hydrate dehydratase / NAD(P)H-hydrate epimerase